VTGELIAPDRRALEAAVQRLEQPPFAIRLANLAGKPLDGAVKLLPRAHGALHRVVHRAMLESLTIAIESRDDQDFVPSAWRARALTGLTGGVGGFFGGMLLPVELPLTITLMLRAIADIASHQGEDLRQLESRLACLQVFAMGDRSGAADGAISYYAVRATLSRLTTDLVTSLAQRGTADASAPVVARLVAEVVGRFGFVVSERAAATAVPVLGALGGATLNVVFMDHFERIATGHFTVRRLERRYGPETVALCYQQAARRLRPGVALAAGR
jgi:hypothetical protein